VQECIRSDIAIAAFIRGALRHLVRRLEEGSLALPDRAVLIHDLDETIREGTRANVQAPHLRFHSRRLGGPVRVRRVLEDLLEAACLEITRDEQAYLPIVELRIQRGNLAERIRHQLLRRSRDRGTEFDAAIRSVYGELMECLDENRPWEG
jgi:hypothetical protein